MQIKQALRFIISHSPCAEQYGDMSADTQTHSLTPTHPHTIKPPTAGVQLVGHTSKTNLYPFSADIRLKEHRDALAVISSNGDVLWVPMAIFKSTCHIDILYFPYDEQTCYMKFGSWTYDGYMLDIDFFGGLKAVDISDYTVCM